MEFRAILTKPNKMEINVDDGGDGGSVSLAWISRR